MASLSSFGISPSIITKLYEADFLYDSDINHLKPTELSTAAKLSLKESLEAIRLTSSKPALLSQAVNLKEIVEQKEEIDHIVTFCESLDELLGGGILLRAITEISGTPGIGKTQICLQACISVQLPESIGGVQGEAVYIDTEGSFSILRLKEIAEWTEKHTKQVLKLETNASFNTDTMLKGVYYFRCNNYLELLAVIKNLYHFLENHKRVRLVVVDSIAFHFRHDFTDMMARTSLLHSLAQDLIHQASNHKLAVLITNQMTTKIESQGCSHMVTALGDTWGHCPTVRLLLHWSGCMRMVKISKAPHMPQSSSVYFQITSGGIRDVLKAENVQDKGKKRKLN